MYKDFEDGSRVIQGLPLYYQGNTNTCAQACVTSILNYWGYNVRYEDIIAQTSNPDMSYGMTTDQIIWYFRKYNLKAKSYKGKLSDIKTYINHAIPTIVAFDEKSLQHVVVMIGYNDYREMVYYNDSMYHGVTEEPYSDFVRSWSRKRLNSFGYLEESLSNLLIAVGR